jgi:hypothetical protein
MWTQEECSAFFARMFGLELTDIELAGVWGHLSQNQITPVSRHGGNNVAFTPAILLNLITLATQRTQSTLQSPRFKKVSEEIMPTVFFTLLMKRLSLGEFLIVSSDAPDIALVDFDSTKPVEPSRRLNAVPLEAMFIPEQAIAGANGSSTAEKIANLIISRKFNKRYPSQTILLVTLMAEVKNLDMAELSAALLRNGGSPFDSIGIFVGLGGDDCLIATLLPILQIHRLNVSKDLLPLIY